MGKVSYLEYIVTIYELEKNLYTVTVISSDITMDMSKNRCM